MTTSIPGSQRSQEVQHLLEEKQKHADAIAQIDGALTTIGVALSGPANGAASIPLADRLKEAFIKPKRGVLGMVDDLAEASREHGWRLDWNAGRCRVCPMGNDPACEAFELPLAKSVFRALLARVAALCNQRAANSVSPYEGLGEFAVGNGPVTIFEAAFKNTPGEQTLRILKVDASRPAK